MWLLASDLASRPTRIAEILPTAPAFVGSCDAAKVGMGGVWIPPDIPTNRTPDHSPIVWREPFPSNIQESVISDKNPAGTITNSDLELAGVIAHNAIIAREVDVRERTVATLCDNISATSWQRKGSVTTAGAASYLMRESCLHQRANRYIVSQTSYIPGPENVMADDASRRFDLSDNQLVSHFNSNYPQPRSWQLRHLPSRTSGQLISALRKERPARLCLKAEPVPLTRSGTRHGSPIVHRSTLTPFWKESMTKSPSSACSLPGSGTAGPLGARSRSELERYLTISYPSRRRLPAWGPLTPV